MKTLSLKALRSKGLKYESVAIKISHMQDFQSPLNFIRVERPLTMG